MTQKTSDEKCNPAYFRNLLSAEKKRTLAFALREIQYTLYSPKILRSVVRTRPPAMVFIANSLRTNPKSERLLTHRYTNFIYPILSGRYITEMWEYETSCHMNTNKYTHTSRGMYKCRAIYNRAIAQRNLTPFRQRKWKAIRNFGSQKKTCKTLFKLLAIFQ